MKMKQVKLINERTNGIDTSWIDEKHAFIGSRVSFKGNDDVMRVTEVYDVSVDQTYINERSRDHLNARKATDI